MLIIVPPSEAKAPAPDHGPPVDLEGLSFPALTPTRRRILDAVIETSAEPDALRRMYAGPTVAEEIARNTALRELATMPVLDVYTGPLHEGLDAATLTPAARARADRELVVGSALWGALRPRDRIPPYRVHVCSHLLGIDGLEPTWRAVLPDVLAEVARDGVVLDLRSPSYQATGRPTGRADRTVTVRVVDASGDATRLGDVVAKRTRGQVARYVLESGLEPEGPHELAGGLGERWPIVDLAPPVRPGQPWILSLTAPG